MQFDDRPNALCLDTALTASISRYRLTIGFYAMKHAFWFCVVFSIDCSAACADKFVMDSVAGTGSPENNGDSGPARLINVGDPFGVEIGPDGAVHNGSAASSRSPP